MRPGALSAKFPTGRALSGKSSKFTFSLDSLTGCATGCASLQDYAADQSDKAQLLLLWQTVDLDSYCLTPLEISWTPTASVQFPGPTEI